MTDDFLFGVLGDGESASSAIGGKFMGILYGQKFYAVRAGGPDFKIPFAVQNFTALISMSSGRDDAVLEKYARNLISHGCVQAICQGSGAERMDAVFTRLAEGGGLDKNGVAFTSMCMEDEPLQEALHYFVLPCGLASIGLILVIGDSGDFEDVLAGFNHTAGDLLEMRGESIYVDEELSCCELV